VLVADERIRLISFTGSAEVGWALRKRAARKTVALELGNSTPALVEADADLDEAAEKLVDASFSFAGQTCISVQRIFVWRAVYQDFLARFLPRVEALKVGDPSEEQTDVGPVVDEASRDSILA
jgi:acyl-CoA reductase-like NAD-dependent aldehyde dehydrogenase